MSQIGDATRIQRGGALRGMVRAGLLMAAAGSVACTVYAGRHNKSFLLVGLFAVWVLSPFGGLAWAERAADKLPNGMASAMRASALVISICSLCIYVAVAASPPGHHNAFPFLAVPGASWLAILPMLIVPRIAAKR
jgi:hypothetical protein